MSLSGLTAPNTPPNLTPSSPTAANMASGHTVTAEFQQATTTNPDAIDWATIGDTTTLVASSLSGVNVAYQGTMTFPSYAAVPGSHHRILFREYEVFAADAENGARDGIGIVQVGQAATSYKTRQVYVDAVSINL